MVNDAQAHADEDKKKREAVDIKNRADSMVYQTERQLKDNGDKIPADLKQPIEEGLERLKKAIADNDTAQMDSVMKELESKMHAFAEELYRNAQAQPGNAGAAPGAEGFGGGPQTPPGETTGGKTDDNVIDADFRDVSDDKK